MLTHAEPRVVGARVPDAVRRLLGQVQRLVLGSCRPAIGTLGMADRPWRALLWIVAAAVLALLFVITFLMFEGSMWT